MVCVSSEDMSPAEIQQKFSLPETPTHIVDVKPDVPSGCPTVVL